MDIGKADNKKKKKTQEQIWTERLSSPNEEVVRDTIKEIRDYGNVKILPAIIEKYSREENNNIRKELYKLLMDVKRKEAVDIIFMYIKNDSFKNIRRELLSILWQTRMDFSPYVGDLVELFITEPFEIAFEAFTVIEYLDYAVDKQIAQENIDKLKKHIQTIEQSKKFLLVDLVKLLERWA